MIVITGAAGFIGSVLVGYLNQQGIDDLLLFDDLPDPLQFKNLVGKKFISLHSTDEIPESGRDISHVIHLGANSNTLENNWSDLYKQNVLSTRCWNHFCEKNQIPFIFTSSSAVYGNGKGPMNQYAFSKSISEQEISAVVLRLFNVYGPNEYHKGRMASTIYHWFNQLVDRREMNVFENSDRYCRDFVWVEDVAKTIMHFMNNYQPGIYDVGTGSSIDFDTLADITISLSKNGTKNYINMPDDLQQQYQYQTQANTTALEKSGLYVGQFLDVNQGLSRYSDYLINRRYY
jgi:ADP-L-glycero-D-manno-heptose 6-epimerase